MSRFLPAAWLVLIPVAAALSVFGQFPRFGNFGMAILASQAVGMVTNALFLGAYAVLYALLNRVAQSPLVFRLGWSHLAFALLARASSSFLNYLRNQAFADGERMSVEEILIWAIIPVIMSLLASISFLAALLAAFRDVRRRIDLQAFD